MKIGRFEETEKDTEQLDQSDDFENEDIEDESFEEDVEDSMDESAEGEDDSIDEKEVEGEDADSRLENTEKNSIEGDNSEEQKSPMERLKDKISSLFDKIKPQEEQSDADKVEETDNQKENNRFADSLKVDFSPEEQAKVAKDFREAHNLDEHGNRIDGSGDSSTDTSSDVKTHGEDGERTLASDREASNGGREIDDER